MPSRARLDEFIAVVESGDHAGAIERYYTEDSSMQENAAPPRVGRDVLVAHERAVLARMSHVYSKAVSSVVEGDRVAIHWIFELTDKSGQVRRVDEVALQEWRGDRIFRDGSSTIRRRRRLELSPRCFGRARSIVGAGLLSIFVMPETGQRQSSGKLAPSRFHRSTKPRSATTAGGSSRSALWWRPSAGASASTARASISPNCIGCMAGRPR